MEEKRYTGQEIIDSMTFHKSVDPIEVAGRMGYEGADLDKIMGKYEVSDFKSNLWWKTNWFGRHPLFGLIITLGGAAGLIAAAAKSDSEDNPLEGLETAASGSSEFDVHLDDPVQDVYYEEQLDSPLGYNRAETDTSSDYPAADIESLVCEDLGDEFKITLKLKGDFKFNDAEIVTNLISLVDADLEKDSRWLLLSENGVLYNFRKTNDYDNYYELPKKYYKIEGNTFEVTFNKKVLGDKIFSPGAAAFKGNVRALGPLENESKDIQFNVQEHKEFGINESDMKVRTHWVDIVGKLLYWDSDRGFDKIRDYANIYGPGWSNFDEKVKEYEWGTNIKDPELIEPDKPDDKDGIGYEEPLAAAALLSATLLTALRNKQTSMSSNYNRKSDRLKRH